MLGKTPHLIRTPAGTVTLIFVRRHKDGLVTSDSAPLLPNPPINLVWGQLSKDVLARVPLECIARRSKDSGTTVCLPTDSAIIDTVIETLCALVFLSRKWGE